MVGAGGDAVLPYRYEVQVMHLLASPLHRYEGRPGDGPRALPSGAPEEARRNVEVRAHLGIRALGTLRTSFRIRPAFRVRTPSFREFVRLMIPRMISHPIEPAIFTYFLTYSQDAGTIAFGLGDTFGLMLILIAYLAVVFQIPLIMMLAIMMGITTRAWLADKRLYFWGGFLGLAFLSSPDPTGMAPIIIALTMAGLFEGTLLVLKWVGR